MSCECPICLEQKKQKQNKTLPCNHSVCFECYNKLLQHKIFSCPMCRYNFKTDVENIYYKIRKRRRNLTLEEYNDRKHKIKQRYRLRTEKKHKRFYKSGGIEDLY